MSRGSGRPSASASGDNRRGYARSNGSGAGASTDETRALAAFLRDLAERAEREPALAETLRDALRASGLLSTSSRPQPGGDAGGTEAPRAATRRVTRLAGTAPAAAAGDGPPDPFVVLRERGEAGLRAALDGLELAALRSIVRMHRLDPARISARWTVRERVIELIVQQVRGRANLGKAFARV